MNKEAMYKIAEEAIRYGYYAEMEDMEKEASFLGTKAKFFLGGVKNLLGSARQTASSINPSGVKDVMKNVAGLVQRQFPGTYKAVRGSKFGGGVVNAVKKGLNVAEDAINTFSPKTPPAPAPSLGKKLRWPMIGLGGGILLGGTMGYKNNDSPPIQKHYG